MGDRNQHECKTGKYRLDRSYKDRHECSDGQHGHPPHYVLSIDSRYRRIAQTVSHGVAQLHDLEQSGDRKCQGINDHRNEVGKILAEERTRKRHEGDRHKEENVTPDEAVIPVDDHAVNAVVPDPVSADDHKAEEVTDETRQHLRKRYKKVAACCVVLKMRYLYLDDQQSDRDRKHRVAEEHDAFQLQLTILAFIEHINGSVKASFLS